MKVTSSASGVVMTPTGPLDDEGCAALRHVISTALSSGFRHVVIDLSEVTHVALEAVQLLRGVEQYLHRHHGGLLVAKASPAAERGLRAHDLMDLLLVDDLPVAWVRPSSAKAG